MEEKIIVNCPHCSAQLKINRNIESVKVCCPVCKEGFLPKDAKQVTKSDSDCTQLNEKTVPPVARKEHVLGVLRKVVGGSEQYQLKLGKNVVGRKANVSSADIQIPAGESRRMSREHVVIEVKTVEGRGLAHYISLYKEKLNPTFVGDEKLEYGDCLVLNQGDEIKLPDCTLIFEIPDEEGTEINN